VLHGPMVFLSLDVGPCDVDDPRVFGHEDLVCDDPLTTRVKGGRDERGEDEMMVGPPKIPIKV